MSERECEGEKGRERGREGLGVSRWEKGEKEGGRKREMEK